MKYCGHWNSKGIIWAEPSGYPPHHSNPTMRLLPWIGHAETSRVRSDWSFVYAKVTESAGALALVVHRHEVNGTTSTATTLSLRVPSSSAFKIRGWGEAVLYTDGSLLPDARIGGSAAILLSGPLVRSLWPTIWPTSYMLCDYMIYLYDTYMTIYIIYTINV